MNCAQIVSWRGATPAKVSHHLKILSHAGLIESRRAGELVYSQKRPRTFPECTRALPSVARKKRVNPGTQGFFSWTTQFDAVDREAAPRRYAPGLRVFAPAREVLHARVRQVVVSHLPREKNRAGPSFDRWEKPSSRHRFFFA